MADRRNDHRAEGWSETGPHDQFLELCALSTTGELSEDEQRKLRDHLAECPECRLAIKEFEAAADIAVPLLAPALSPDAREESVAVGRDTADAREIARTSELVPTLRIGEEIAQSEASDSCQGLVFSSRNGHRGTPLNWNYVWMPLAAAVVLTASLGIYSYQVGKHRGVEIAQLAPRPTNTPVEGLEARLSDIGHESEVLKMQLRDRERTIADLHRQVREQSASLNELKTAQADLEQSLQNDATQKQQVAQELAQERGNLKGKLDAAHASLEKIQAELDSVRQQRSLDQSRSESLEAQIRDLHGQLRDRERTINKEEELLAHDRDIRELMGARDLYIAEIYDVGRDGATQKPYGRVFYTRGKSLIFYAYDLDQQPGATGATFQAWGRRGPDTQQALNLGVFYKDDLGKKRWVLKFEDPKMLDQIDAVFVTLERDGVSHKPNGKSLLFAYLKVNPNHP